MQKWKYIIIGLCLSVAGVSQAHGPNINSVHRIARTPVTVALPACNPDVFSLLVFRGQSLLQRYNQVRLLLVNESRAHRLADRVEGDIAFLSPYVSDNKEWLLYAIDVSGFDWREMARRLVMLYTVLEEEAPRE